jgi:hypothetical protein
MERIRVKSSNICSIGYDSNNSLLEIEFMNGSIYHFYGIHRNIFDGLMNAQSHGRYFASMIKNEYRYRRIE